MSKAENPKQCPITSEKFTKYSKYYNGLINSIEKYEKLAQSFLDKVATFHKTSTQQILDDFKGLEPNFHNEKVKDLNEDFKLPENVSQYCKKGSKLLKALKIKVDDMRDEEEQDIGTSSLLPSEDLLYAEDNNETLTKCAKHYDGINFIIKGLNIKLENYINELASNTNMDAKLVTSLLDGKSQDHETYLKFLDEGINIVIPLDFNLYCRYAKTLLVALSEDNLDLGVNISSKTYPFSHEDNVGAMEVMGGHSTDQ